VRDRRRTPDAEAEQAAKLAAMQTEQKAKGDTAARAFIAHYGSGGRVTVPAEQMAVVAKVCYDNSDSMTDYFDRHASLSQDFALAVVPKQAETERLAQRGVAVGAAVFAGVEFDWHTEKGSMGHGNYLESGGFELPAELQGLRNRYGSGQGVTHAHWEVSFRQAWREEALELDTIAGWGQPGPGTKAQTEMEASPENATADGVTVTENDEKDGIEIRFPAKPAAEVLDALKAAGWRWSRFSACWYTRRTEAARRFAEELQGQGATA
jgi:hypothetical protein